MSAAAGKLLTELSEMKAIEQASKPDYDVTELYTILTIGRGKHKRIDYVRLLPDSTELEALFGGNGAYEGEDAERARRLAWPDAVYVKFNVMVKVLKRRLQPRQAKKEELQDRSVQMEDPGV